MFNLKSVFSNKIINDNKNYYFNKFDYKKYDVNIIHNGNVQGPIFNRFFSGSIVYFYNNFKLIIDNFEFSSIDTKSKMAEIYSNEDHKPFFTKYIILLNNFSFSNTEGVFKSWEDIPTRISFNNDNISYFGFFNYENMSFIYQNEYDIRTKKTFSRYSIANTPNTNTKIYFDSFEEFKSYYY